MWLYNIKYVGYLIMKDNKQNIIDNNKIMNMLEQEVDTSSCHIEDILAKGRELNGITSAEVLSLLKTEDKDLINKIYDCASYIKQEIYGNRLVLFAPLYISNLCRNECLYCAFRVSNKDLVRKALSQKEIDIDTTELLKQGHKRVLVD